MNFILILCVISVASFSSAKSSLGSPEELKGSQLKAAERIVQQSLSQLVFEGGPLFKLVQVNSGTLKLHVVALSVDFEDEFKEVITCKVEIQTGPWRAKTNIVEYSCPDRRKFTDLVNA